MQSYPPMKPEKKRWNIHYLVGLAALVALIAAGIANTQNILMGFNA